MLSRAEHIQSLFHTTCWYSRKATCDRCYIGKRRMEKAISRFKQSPQGKDVDFEVRRLPSISPWG